jgi:hypothetical protein
VDAHVAALLLKKYEADPHEAYWVRYAKDVRERYLAGRAAKAAKKAAGSKGDQPVHKDE